MFAYKHEPYPNLSPLKWVKFCDVLGREGSGDFEFPGGAKYSSHWKDPGRPHPTGPLFLHPTVYPGVSRTDHHFGKASTTEITNWTGYHPYPEIVDFTHTLFEFHSLETLNGFAEPRMSYLDWPLAVRLKVKKESVNLGASLAEYRQTANMFKKTALGLFNMYRGIKKQTFKSLKKNLRHKPYVKFVNGKPSQTYFRKHFGPNDITDAYLMTRYGINPLMGDIHSSLMKLRLKSLQDIWRKSYVKLEETIPVSDDGVIGTIKQSVKATCYTQLKADGDFTIGNPLELAHELTPYSFVLDWMFNLGDILSSLDAFKNVHSMIGSASFLTDVKLERPVGASSPVGDVTVKESFNQQSFHRSTFTHADVPNASFVPSYEPSTSMINVVDGLALLHQIRRG